MDTSEIYTAVASANFGLLRANKSEMGSFVSPGKNTILHIYIISQSKKAKGGQKLVSALRSVGSWFQEKPEVHLSRAEAVQEVLKEWPELLGKANAEGDTPLHMAARHGHDDIAKALIEHVKVKERADANGEKQDMEAGKDVGDEESVQRAVWKMLHETNSEKETALHQAVRYSHYEVAKVLVDEDDPSFVYSENDDGETILYMAAERDKIEVLRLILNKYTSPAYQGPNGRTAMHAAVLQLLDGPSFASFCAYAVMREKEGLELLATKADNEGKTPLHYMPNLVLFFGDKSAISMVDKDGNTALHIAAGKGDSGSVEMFIEKCPECFEVVDQQGRNALHLAVTSGDKRTVDVILESEFLCDLLKKKDNNGNTPLHLLATCPNIWPRVLKDRRFDRMAINRDKLNPAEVLLTSNSTPTLLKRERRIGKCLKDASTYRRRRQTNSDTTNVNVEGQEVNRNYGDSLQDARQSHLVVAALIATVTFAAGFTLPGGYIQEKGADLGHAVLTKNTAFVVFVISDTIGLVFSCAAVFIHLLIAIEGYNEKKIVRKLFENALPLTLLAIVAMVIAFICGLYSVLSHAPSLAVSTSIIGMVFFYLLGYLCEEARETTNPIFGWVPKTLTQLVNMLFRWVHRRLEIFAYYLVVAGFYILAVPFFPLWALLAAIEWYQSRKSKNQDPVQSASFSEAQRCEALSFGLERKG